MTYLVKQKIRGRTYAYEAENFWNSEKKQSRQKRNYLGVWDDASGQILPKIAERDVKTTKSLGPAYLLDSIGSEIQLRCVFRLSITKVIFSAHSFRSAISSTK